MNAARFYYRCADCLGVCTTSEQLRGDSAYIRGAKYGACGACGGSLEYMGRVERDRLVKDSVRSACDERCTGARGPLCDCRCGGANHGSGLYVEVTIDQGGIPVARMQNGAHLQSQAKTYRNLAAAVQAHIDLDYGAVINRKRAGEYIEGDQYRRYLKGTAIVRQLAEARAMRSHHGRNARLREMMTKHQIAEPAQVWQDQPEAEWNTARPTTVRGSQSSLF